MKIEKTFIISLPSRLLDRLVPLIDYLKSIDLDYFTYSAIKNYDGKLGLLLTMEKLLNECIFEGYSSVMILEDDAHFLSNNFKENLDDYTNQLPENFDMCYLGVNLFEDNVQSYSPNLIKLHSGYATHAIIYSKKGLRKALEAIISKKHNHLPLDEIMVRRVQNEGNCYAVFPMLVSQKSGFSDIEGREVNYDKFLTDRFNEKTKHLKNNLEV